MRNDITSWKLFEELDIKLFDINNFDINILNENIKKENRIKIKKYFSAENYLKQLEDLFRSE